MPARPTRDRAFRSRARVVVFALAGAVLALLVEGSNGGAGLRVLRGEEPEPLTATVLYFDPDTRRVVAYDRITVRGLGETGARIVRHVVDDGDEGDRE